MLCLWFAAAAAPASYNTGCSTVFIHASKPASPDQPQLESVRSNRQCELSRIWEGSLEQVKQRVLH